MVRGCDAVVSCLGQNPSSALGIWANSPRLCSDVTRSVCHAAALIKPAAPIKLVMVSASLVDHPDGSTDPPRGFAMKAILLFMEKLIPPHADNVATARVLFDEVSGAHNPYVDYCAVRPDLLTDGPLGNYTAHARHQSTSFFNPGETARANVGAFMAELAAVDSQWAQWKNNFPTGRSLKT